MKHLRAYDINWYGLAFGEHRFVYEISDEEIRKMGYENGDYEGIEASVALFFDKQQGFFQLKFDVDGFITVPCDRCGELFKLQLWDEFNLIVKLTDAEGDVKKNEEEHDDVVFLPRKETILNVSEWLYEFVMLSIPIQRVHPKNDQGQSLCNQETLRLLERMQDNQNAPKSIWKDLDKFK